MCVLQKFFQFPGKCTCGWWLGSHLIKISIYTENMHLTLWINKRIINTLEPKFVKPLRKTSRTPPSLLALKSLCVKQFPFSRRAIHLSQQLLLYTQLKQCPRKCTESCFGLRLSCTPDWGEQLGGTTWKPPQNWALVEAFTWNSYNSPGKWCYSIWTIFIQIFYFFLQMQIDSWMIFAIQCIHQCLPRFPKYSLCLYKCASTTNVNKL